MPFVPVIVCFLAVSESNPFATVTLPGRYHCNSFVPVQPVDTFQPQKQGIHLVVSRLVPSNSSWKTIFQVPGLPVGSTARTLCVEIKKNRLRIRKKYFLLLKADIFNILTHRRRIVHEELMCRNNHGRRS